MYVQPFLKIICFSFQKWFKNQNVSLCWKGGGHAPTTNELGMELNLKKWFL